MTCSLELLNTTRGLRTPKHGGCYLMDGGVADTACHTQAVVLLKLFNTTRKLSGPLSRTVVSLSVVGASTGAMHRSRGLLRTGRRRYRWCAKSRGIPTPNPSGIIYPHLWCYLLNVDSPDRHDRLKSLWSESGIRSITRVMSPALPWALPWAPALPRRAGHRELVRRWAHGHALW